MAGKTVTRALTSVKSFIMRLACREVNPAQIVKPLLDEISDALVRGEDGQTYRPSALFLVRHKNGRVGPQSENR